MGTREQRWWVRQRPAQQLGYVPGWGKPPTYLQWGVNLWQLGGQQLTPDRQKVAYNTPLGVQALQTMVDQMKVIGGYQASQTFSAANKPPSGPDLFSAGHLGMYSNGVWPLTLPATTARKKAYPATPTTPVDTGVTERRGDKCCGLV